VAAPAAIDRASIRQPCRDGVDRDAPPRSTLATGHETPGRGLRCSRRGADACRGHETQGDNMDRNISPRLGVAVLLAVLILGCQPSQPEGSAEAPAPDAAPSAEARQQAPGSDSGMQSPLPADMPTRDTTVVDTV